ncbi:hypothetical protein OAO18_08045, partial [Francisellaceae bacterium]|nr:hypothetical protein [Francisellaceae bacterium]
QSIILHEQNPNGGHGLNKTTLNFDDFNINNTFRVCTDANINSGLGYNKIVALNGDGHNTVSAGNVKSQKMILSAFSAFEEISSQNWNVNNIFDTAAIMPNVDEQLVLFYQTSSQPATTPGNSIGHTTKEKWNTLFPIQILQNDQGYSDFLSKYMPCWGKNNPSDDEAAQFSCMKNLFNYGNDDLHECPLIIKDIQTYQYRSQDSSDIYYGKSTNIIHGLCQKGLANIGFIIHFGENDDQPKVYWYGLNLPLTLSAQYYYQGLYNLLAEKNGFQEDFGPFGSESTVTWSAFTTAVLTWNTFPFMAFQDSSSTKLMLCYNVNSSVSTGAVVDISQAATLLIDLDNDFIGGSVLADKINFTGDKIYEINYEANYDSDGNLSGVDYQQVSTNTTVSYSQCIRDIGNYADDPNVNHDGNSLIQALENQNFCNTYTHITAGSQDYAESQMIMAVGQDIIQFSPYLMYEVENDTSTLCVYLTKPKDPDVNNHPNKIYSGAFSGARGKGASYSIDNDFKDETFMLNFTVNHQGLFRLFITYDGSKTGASITATGIDASDIKLLYIISQASDNTINEYAIADSKVSLDSEVKYIPIDHGYRLLKWNYYYHDKEAVYVRDKKTQTQTANNPASEYVYIAKDPISKDWKTRVIKIQASQDDYETFCTASSIQDVHHIEVFGVDDNNQIALLSDSEYIEVRFDIACSVADYSDPYNPTSFQATRLTSYFVKPVMGKVYLNVFLESNDIQEGATMYYRLVDTDHFNSGSLTSSPILQLNDDVQQIVNWSQFNISYKGHARLNTNYSNDLQYQDSSNDASSKISSQVPNCNNLNDVVSNNLKEGSNYSASDIQQSWTNGYSQVSQSSAPAQDATLTLSTLNIQGSVVINPIASTVNLTTSSIGARQYGGFWSDIADALSDTWNAMKNAISELVNKLEDEWRNLSDTLSAVWNDIKNGDFSDLWSDIKSCIMALGTLILTVILVAVAIIIVVIVTILKFLCELAGHPGYEILNGVKTLLDCSAGSPMEKLINGAKEAAEESFDEIATLLEEGYDKIKDEVDELYDYGEKLISSSTQRIFNRFGLKLKDENQLAQNEVDHHYANSVNHSYLLNELQKNTAGYTPSTSDNPLFDDIDPSDLPFSHSQDQFNKDNPNLQSTFSNISLTSLSSAGSDVKSVDISSLSFNDFGGSLCEWMVSKLFPNFDMSGILNQEFIPLPSALKDLMGADGILTNEDVLAVVLTFSCFISLTNPTTIAVLAAFEIKDSKGAIEGLINMNTWPLPAFGNEESVSGLRDTDKLATLQSSVLLMCVLNILYTGVRLGRALDKWKNDKGANMPLKILYGSLCAIRTVISLVQFSYESFPSSSAPKTQYISYFLSFFSIIFGFIYTFLQYYTGWAKVPDKVAPYLFNTLDLVGTIFDIIGVVCAAISRDTDAYNWVNRGASLLNDVRSLLGDLWDSQEGGQNPEEMAAIACLLIGIEVVRVATFTVYLTVE